MPSIRNPYFPAIANTWSQQQRLAGGLGIPGNAGNNPGQYFYSYAEAGFNPSYNVGWYLTRDGIIFNVPIGTGLYVQSQGSTSQIVGLISTPSSSTPPIPVPLLVYLL